MHMYAYKVDALICYYCCHKLSQMWWFQKNLNLLFHGFVGQKYGGNLNSIYQVSYSHAYHRAVKVMEAKISPTIAEES